MTTRRKFMFGLAAAGTAAISSADDLATELALFQRGLVLEPARGSRGDSDRIGGPVIRWDDSIDKWRMWYYGRWSGFPQDIAPSLGSGCIMTAVSDDGISWKREDGALAGGAVLRPSQDPDAFDSTHIGTGDVIRRGDEWLMVYFGGNREKPTDTAAMFADNGLRMRIGLARSTDGRHWQRIRGKETGGATIDVGDRDVYVAFPGLLDMGDRILVHYTTVDKRARYWRTRLAESENGRVFEELGDLMWTTRPALFEAGGVITRDIIANPLGNGRWLMVYTAKDGRAETGARRSIAAAVSDDAIHWRRLHDKPIFTVGIEGAWDHAGVAVPRLTVTPRAWLLHYYGWSDQTFGPDPQRGIGAATASPGDLLGFRRVSV
jgi:predicted GH43/DUF377 family glycosyl hydrolase